MGDRYPDIPRNSGEFLPPNVAMVNIDADPQGFNSDDGRLDKVWNEIFKTGPKWVLTGETGGEHGDPKVTKSTRFQWFLTDHYNNLEDEPAVKQQGWNIVMPHGGSRRKTKRRKRRRKTRRKKRKKTKHKRKKRKRRKKTRRRRKRGGNNEKAKKYWGKPIKERWRENPLLMVSPNAQRINWVYKTMKDGIPW
jgi:hypothetical protein